MHAPGECEYCDASGLQEIREMWGINFTGKYEPGKYLCPAELQRPLSVINRWGGNTPGAPFDGEALAAYLLPMIPSYEEVRAASQALQRLLNDLTPPI